MNANFEGHEPAANCLATLVPPVLQHFDLVAQAPGGVARLRELIFELAAQGKLLTTDSDASFQNLDFVAEFVMGQAPPGNECNTTGIGTIFVKTGEFGPLYPVVREWTTKPLKMAKQGDVLICVVGATIGKLNLGIDCAIGRSVAAIRPDCSLDSKYLYYALMPFTLALRRSSRGSAQGVIGKSELGSIRIRVPSRVEQSSIVARVEELMALCDALEEKGRLEAAQHERLARALFDALANSASAEETAENWQRIAAHFDLLLGRPAVVDRLEQTILQLGVCGRLVPQNPADEPASALLQKIRAERDHLIATGQLKRDKPQPPISDEEKPLDLPEGWKWVTLETIAHVGTGTTPSRDNSAYFQTGSIPWVTSGETGQPFIADTSERVTQLALNETNLTLYPEGTLIVAMYGQGKTRGQISELLIEATTNQACAAIVLVERHADHRAYVKLVFEKSYDEIRELSAGGAQPNLNVGKVKATGIPLPPLAEQSRIVARVAELRALCAQLRARLTSAAQTQSRLAEALLEQAVA